MEIEGKSFVVTGGASGLGAATVRMLVEGGGRVCSPTSRRTTAARSRHR